MTIEEILKSAIKHNATDVHLVAYKPPIYRIDGDLIPSNYAPLEADDLKDLIWGILTERQKDQFSQNMELDFSYFCLKDHHCRVNVHIEKRNMAANIRIMPTRIRSTAELGLPPTIKELARKRSGMIVITGPAGSGKTTTMTTMVDIINNERKCKIITIEDPIEYVHQSKKSVVIQREVGSDTQSFEKALKYALRQDPDVVVVGEMRDLESISMALTTAETGHLVLTTLHAPNTIEAIHRIIDVYPPGRQEQIRVQMADSLIAIIGQGLVKGKGGFHRVLATEVLLANMSVRNMIRRGALLEIRGQLDSEGSGMQTFENSLSDLVKADLITKETAIEHAKYPNMLKF